MCDANRPKQSGPGGIPCHDLGVDLSMTAKSQNVPKYETVLVRFGILVPVLYYGIQLLAAPTYPGYSFIGNVASELGSDKSPYAGVFNIGIFAVGVAALLASVGFLLTLKQRGTHLVLASITALAVACNGFQSLWAGLHPMPDPRHGGHPAFLIAMLALPYLMSAAMWRHLDSRWLKAYYVASMLVIVVMAPIMSGKMGVDTVALRGLLQRILTLGVFPTIGVSAYLLAKKST